jgi:hypothetical protein
VVTKRTLDVYFDHYEAARKLLDRWDPPFDDNISELLAGAHVHATLALAAAVTRVGDALWSQVELSDPDGELYR